MSWIDILIVFAYLVGIIFFGFWVSNRANQNLESYFLGENKIPWYVLGLSNASGMFDISGVMWSVTLLVVYGMKSAWIPWLWPVWNQVFVMVFLAVWIRRSQVMTGAQWIHYRFGRDKGGNLSHIIVSIFALISTVGFIAYFFVGIGKFSAIFFPWDLGIEIMGVEVMSEQSYALIIMIVTSMYVIKGGMFSVVATEVAQFFLMTVGCILIAIVAWRMVSPEEVAALVPDGWSDLWFGWKLDLEWSGYLTGLNRKIEEDGFGMIGALVMMMLFKGIFASLAGPVPSYDLQRILSTRTPHEAAKMSGFTMLVLFFPRYLMIAGFGVIALVHVLPELVQSGSLDYELALPHAILYYLPSGVRGVLIAGLLAAFMGTFAAFINAAPAYFVNDIYKTYLYPDQSGKQYLRVSYLSSLFLVAIGILGGFFAESINSITLWITSALYGGYAAANVLKWIWWRFNGYGYFFGMLSGLLGATFIPISVPDTPDIFLFPWILMLSFGGSILGTLVTKAQSMEELAHFYKTTRPWGFWAPVIRYIQASDAQRSLVTNKDLPRDLANVVVGVVWQMAMIVCPMFLMVRDWGGVGWSVVVFVVTSMWLYLCWWIPLRKNEAGLPAYIN